MIRNPWPNKHQLPQDKDWCYIKRRGRNEIKAVFCPYSIRHTLVCVAQNKRKECKNCYWRQQSMGYQRMSAEGIFIERYCDRCGAMIENPDTPMYLMLQDKIGRMVINLEICRDCAAEIADWVGGIELPSSSEVDESVWD